MKKELELVCWTGQFLNVIEKAKDRVMSLQLSGDSKGAWVGHALPQIFGWPPACPPSFVLDFTFKFV